jgi:membrane protein
MRLISFLKQLGQGFGTDKIGQLSAAFAYGALFSLGPLLLMLISIIGFVYGDDAASGKLFDQLSATLGPDTAETIQTVVANTHKSSAGTLAFILGVVGMLLGAAGITSQLQNSMNSILGVVPDPKGGIRRTIYVKLKNVLLVVLGGTIVLATLIISAVIAGLGSKVQEQIGISPVVLELLNNGVSLLTLVLLIFWLYKVVPDVRIPNKILLMTSLGVTLLFFVGKLVLAFIIGRNGTASAYGAAATLIALLLWIYYSGQILFLGAEGMKVYAFDNSIEFRPKRFSLHRSTIHVDGSGFGNRLTEAWLRGFRKAEADQKKK